jgi:hypothetical protein
LAAAAEASAAEETSPLAAAFIALFALDWAAAASLAAAEAALAALSAAGFWQEATEMAATAAAAMSSLWVKAVDIKLIPLVDAQITPR